MPADEVEANAPMDPLAAAAASKTQRGAKDGSTGIEAPLSKSCIKVGAGAKRPNLGPDAGGASSHDDDAGDSGDVGALLADIRAEFTSGLASTQNNVLKVIEEHATGYNKRLDDTNAKSNFLGSENDQRKSESAVLRQDFDALKDEIGQLRKTLALEAAKPRSKSVGASTRGADDSDPTLVRLTAKNLVGFDAVQISASSLLERAGFNNADAKLKGPTIGRYFSLEFGGEASTASRRAKKTADCLRSDNGVWESIYVPRPGQQGNEQLFVGLDRSQNEIRKARNLRLLVEAVQATDPALKPWKLPREGVLTVAWQTVAGFVPESNFGRIDWKPAATSQGIDTNKVDESFEKKLEESAESRTKRL